ncbi:deoxyribose-phosphate aldolase [Litorihabitans aurantiacus]|uniref:Deoxyribose-phosphate aldolase n=1 Tax=Litorihabitans aurantiacus TaxID=1930061 RepID=A0AA37XGK3_9MICO|nr:deoxyribose-phosphate aldolase [Litorihabitans aurantiacus]GMA33298.1 deoxyribose-phosphate aldolase [Litorihabitans aurantiacus]
MTRTDADVAALALATLDLTDLGDAATLEGAQELVARASQHGVAAVCVWPRFVAASAQALAGTGVKVATVVNFPSGDEAVADVVAMTRAAVADGADEIDVVLPYRAFLAADVPAAEAVLDGVREAAGAAVVKVIIESGELGAAPVIEAAARLAIDHGAEFVKTSTGKSPVSATPEAAEAILGVIAGLPDGARSVGFKASGGIRSVADARVYVEIADRLLGEDWISPATFRFGASSLLDDVLRVLGSEDSRAPESPTAY